MRNVVLKVGGTPLRNAFTWAYPNGKDLGLYVIPTYQMEVHGKRNDGSPVTLLSG